MQRATPSRPPLVEVRGAPATSLETPGPKRGARVSSDSEGSAMGVLEDLARARTDYERGDWAAALDSWSGVRPARLSDPTISQLVPAVPAIRPG